jgi:hypothetical protein
MPSEQEAHILEGGLIGDPKDPKGKSRAPKAKAPITTTESLPVDSPNTSESAPTHIGVKILGMTNLVVGTETPTTDPQHERVISQPLNPLN